MLTQVYSPKLIDEAEPYLGLVIDGVRLDPDVLRHVTSVDVDEAENKKGTCKITIFDPEDRLIEDGVIDYNSQIIVEIGYRTHFEERGPFTVHDIAEKPKFSGTQLTIKGQEASKLSSTAQRRVFSTGTVRSVFEHVLTRHGIPLVIEGDVDFNVPVDEEYPIVQTGETDGEFLNRIAADFGWTVTITGGKVHLTPPTMRKSLGVIKLGYRRADAQITRLTVKRKKPRVSRVPGKTPKKPQDRMKPKAGTVADDGKLYSDPDDVRPEQNYSADPRQAEVAWSPEVQSYDPYQPPAVTEDGKVAAGQKSVTRKELRTYISDKGDVTFREVEVEVQTDGGAEREAPAMTPQGVGSKRAASEPKKKLGRRVYREGKLKSLTIELKHGHPMFRPQHRLELIGAGSRLDGPYRILSVGHQFTTSRGFNTKIVAAAGWKKPGAKKGAKGGTAEAGVVEPTIEEHAARASLEGGQTTEGGISLPLTDGEKVTVAPTERKRTFISDSGEVTLR